MFDEKQLIQDDLYRFPYHYVPTFNKGQFSQALYLSWGYEYLTYILFVLHELQETRFSSLLDVGCGDGRFLYEVSKQFADKKLLGLDFSKKAILQAKAMSPDVEYICGDITDKQLFDMKFSVVTLIETLEHIPPDFISEFLTGINYYLEEGGKLIITVPSNNLPLNPKHYQHFDFTSLEATVNPYFVVSKKLYVNKLSKQTDFLAALLVNRFFILKERRLLNAIFYIYKKYCFYADSHNAKRLIIVCTKAGER